MIFLKKPMRLHNKRLSMEFIDNKFELQCIENKDSKH